MPFGHIALAVVVALIWGTNFIVIRWGLDELPPFLFATLRFTLVAVPLVFVLRRPAVPLRVLAAVGVLLGVGEFGLLFYAMQSDISPGLASLVIQTQVFFTIALSMAQRGERLRRGQWAAFAIAVGGMVLIGANLNADVTALGLALVLVAAGCWALANIVTRSVDSLQGAAGAVSFVAWSSLFAAPPLLLLALAFEGPSTVSSALEHAGPQAWTVLAWQAVGNSLFGFAAWNWLLARHPAATVTPAALLVPVVGMASSAIATGEALPSWKLAAASLVIAGLAINVVVTRRSIS